MSQATQREIAFFASAHSCVLDFMTAFAQPTPKAPMDAAIDQFGLRANLIGEEVTEFFTAEDKVDMLDGLCDLLYVSIGTYITCGEPLESFSRYAQHKGVLTAAAEAKKQLALQYCEKGLREKISTLCLSVIRAGNALVGDEKFSSAFYAVHWNNMEKFWTEAEVKSVEPLKRYVATFVPSLSHEARCWRVLNADGKVTKSPNHRKVDLSACV